MPNKTKFRKNRKLKSWMKGGKAEGPDSDLMLQKLHQLHQNYQLRLLHQLQNQEVVKATMDLLI